MKLRQRPLRRLSPKLPGVPATSIFGEIINRRNLAIHSLIRKLCCDRTGINLFDKSASYGRANIRLYELTDDELFIIEEAFGK